MLVATEKLILGKNAFAFWQMHAAMSAAHHILAFNGRRLFMNILLSLFQSASIAPYCPENEHGDNDEEQQSTQRVSVTA
ncbi:MAG: hypothetical protein L0H75_05115 [Nitrosospira sp.]|nr:hypothetical protein [Nitrosospira sp.]